MGKLLVIEGLDGCGKATQSDLLAKSLQAAGKTARRISFPDYASDSSALVRMYLSGRFGEKPEDVNAYAASTFYAVDRFASFKSGWGEFYAGGGVIVSDRYTTSNAVHQCSKLPKSEWDAYLDWLFEFEYEKIGIPAPDQIIFLDLPLEVSQQLMTGRYGGDEHKKDIHEKDLDYLARSHEAAYYCAEKYGWHRIDCTENGRLLTIEEIHARVVAATDL